MEATVEGPYFEKASLYVPILRSLPDWFGIETAIILLAHGLLTCAIFVLLTRRCRSPVQGAGGGRGRLQRSQLS